MLLGLVRDGPVWRVMGLDALLGIAVTGVVFLTVLVDLAHPTGASAGANVGFHSFAPMWALPGWLLFGPRGRIDRRSIGVAFVWPAAWVAYTLMRGAATGWYPARAAGASPGVDAAVRVRSASPSPDRGSATMRATLTGTARMAYLWTKTFHLVFVMAWMASVFYLPRILVNIVEAGDNPDVRARLVLMGRRLYRFGHVMMGIAVILGLALWMHFGIAGGWLHAKLALVALVLAHFIVCGRWLKGVETGRRLPSPLVLKIFNEVPVFALVGIVFLVLAKPF